MYILIHDGTVPCVFSSLLGLCDKCSFRDQPNLFYLWIFIVNSAMNIHRENYEYSFCKVCNISGYQTSVHKNNVMFSLTWFSLLFIRDSYIDNQRNANSEKAVTYSYRILFCILMHILWWLCVGIAWAKWLLVD